MVGKFHSPRSKPTIVFCHGFPGYNLNEESAHAFAERGYGVLVFQYRGVRDNPGEYSFRGNEEDILHAIEAVKSFGSIHGLGLLGYSLGGFHTVRLAASNQNLVDFLILMAPVTSFPRLRDTMNSKLSGGFEQFIASGKKLLRGDPEAWLREIEQFSPEEQPCGIGNKIQAPTLIIHGKHDNDVPLEQSCLLHRALVNSKHLFTVLDTDHNFQGCGSQMASEVETFLRMRNLVRDQKQAAKQE